MCNKADSAILKLPKTLSKNGLFYQQLNRTDKAAMYAVRTTHTGNIVGYETFIIKIDKAATKFGRQYPNREHFPSNEEFGIIAWSWINRKDAEASFAGLTCRNAHKSHGMTLEWTGSNGGGTIGAPRR